MTSIKTVYNGDQGAVKYQYSAHIDALGERIVKLIIGYWSNTHGFMPIEEGLLFASLGLSVAPVVVTEWATA